MASKVVALLSLVLLTVVMSGTGPVEASHSEDTSCREKGRQALDNAANSTISRNDRVHLAESYFMLYYMGESCPW